MVERNLLEIPGYNVARVLDELKTGWEKKKIEY